TPPRHCTWPWCAARMRMPRFRALSWMRHERCRRSRPRYVFARNGSILVQSGVAHNGQGHFTAFAQIAATTFHLPATKIEVRMNDSSLPGFSIGTFGSRIAQTAGSAVLLAAKAVSDKVLQVAARVLEAAPQYLVMENGKVMVR